jgi:HSP20 family protein
MLQKKQEAIVPPRAAREPFALLRQMTNEFDRMFGEPFFSPSFPSPSFRGFALPEAVAWSPKVDVFEKDNRLITRVDLPGLKKEDVKVEVSDGHLALSGERKHETEEQRDTFYRSEREYGSFCRTVPLPDGVKLEDIKATFADGVLEVSVPLPVRAEAKVRKVEIEEPAKTVKNAKTAA